MKSRRTLLGSAALMLFVAACNYTVGECYPRGEADGSAEVGVGAGVGPSGAGGYGDMPPGGGGTGANSCNAAPDNRSGEGASTPAPPNDGTELGTYLRCRGMDPFTCMSLCLDMGATCVALTIHPQDPAVGVGKLKQCQTSWPGSTCTYCFSDGTTCTESRVFGKGFKWWCSYTGGKGCE